MDYKNIFLLITAGANLGLGLFIIFKDWRNKINISFSLLLLFITLWSFGVAMFRASSEPAALQFWLNLYYFFGAVIAMVFFYFTTFFPFQVQRIAPVTNFINVLALVTITAVIFFAGLVYEIDINASGDHTVQLNLQSYLLYNTYWLFYITVSFIKLFKKYQGSGSYNKKLIGVVLVATLPAAIAGVFFDLFLPLFSYQYIWIGPYFTMLMVFIIVRYVFIKQPE